MNELRIKIGEIGLRELERQTNKMLKEIKRPEADLLLAQAKLVRDRIREKAPLGPPTDQKPGSLKAAAYALVLAETTTRTVVAYAGIRPRKAPHGFLVEFGHGGPHPAPPHPFVRPAWDEMRDTVRRNIALGMGKAVEDSVK